MGKIEIYRNRLDIAKSTETSLIKEIKDAKEIHKKDLANLKSKNKSKIERLNVRLVDTKKRLVVIETFLKENEDPQIEVDKEIELAIAPIVTK